MSGAELAVGEALLALDEVTRRLRRECPWDREQDERSIVPHTVEEAYELADAAHSGDDAKLVDELGDVLFQVYFLALLLEERDQGDLSTVARHVTDKLIRRHPHVFEREGDTIAALPTNAETPAQVKENWDAIKRTEGKPSDDPLAGVPETLPALMYARKLQRRAAGGTDRSDPLHVLDTVRRDLERLSEAVAAEGPLDEAQEQTSHGSDRLYEEVGGLLFSAVELARSLQVDPEIALRRSTQARVS
jgi:XTP/dITP diphosphohydrolase/tetrapyrrole methylase family protein/MazG family protein/ATP diphosphatase